MSKRLDALRPPELKQLVVFEVFPQRESNPHECGPLVVSMDQERVQIHFAGDTAERWEGTWTELRWLLGRIRLEQEDAAKEAATAERLAQREAEQEQADWLQAQKERQRAVLLRKPKEEP